MTTKLAELKHKWRRGDYLGALKIAAKFHDLGVYKEDIQRGWSAHLQRKSYEQMGEDVDGLIAVAYGAIEQRYDLAGHVDA